VQNADVRKKVVAFGQTYFAVQTRKMEITEDYFNSLDEKEEILDYMGSEELADNLFRIVQTEAKLKNDKVNNEKDANMTHHKVGKEVRDTIKRLGGTMPEDLPTPEKSIIDIELEELDKFVFWCIWTLYQFENKNNYFRH